MATADRLVLEAEVRDRMTSQLRKIAKELGSIGVSPGMKEANGWLNKLTGEATGFIKSGLSAAGAIEALGIGGLAASASIAGLATQIRELGKRNLEMKELARQTGLTVDQLNQFEHAGAHFSVGLDDMGKIVDGLANQMPEMARGTGSLFKELQKFPLLRQRMIDDYRKGDFADAIVGALQQAEQVGKKYGPKARQEFLNDLFPGQGEVAERLFGDGGINGFMAQLKKAQKDLTPISPELLKAERQFADAQESFNRSLENFENRAGPKFLAQMKAMVDEARDFLGVIATPDGHSRKGADATPDHRDHRSLGDAAGDALGDVDRLTRRGGERLKELWNWFSDATADHPRARPQSYDGDGKGLLRRASLITSRFAIGSGSNEFVGVLAAGTKQGFLDAWRELFAQREAEARGGFTRAVWADGGPAGPDFRGRGASGHPGAGEGHGDKGGFDFHGFTRHPTKGSWWTPEREAHAVDRLTKEAGLSRAGAEGLVSRWANVEAGGGPTAVNRASGAVGIAQWLGARRHGFGADFDSQLQHAIRELNSTESHAARVLRHARDAHEAAVGASMFERAERYNPRTGEDAWTGKSYSGAGRVHADVESHLKDMEGRAHARPSPRGAPEALPPVVRTSAPEGHVKVDVHHHGDGKVDMKASGHGITARLYRWPTMTSPETA